MRLLLWKEKRPGEKTEIKRNGEERDTPRRY